MIKAARRLLKEQNEFFLKNYPALWMVGAPHIFVLLIVLLLGGSFIGWKLPLFTDFSAIRDLELWTIPFLCLFYFVWIFFRFKKEASLAIRYKHLFWKYILVILLVLTTASPAIVFAIRIKSTVTPQDVKAMTIYDELSGKLLQCDSHCMKMITSSFSNEFSRKESEGNFYRNYNDTLVLKEDSVKALAQFARKFGFSYNFSLQKRDSRYSVCTIRSVEVRNLYRNSVSLKVKGIHSDSNYYYQYEHRRVAGITITSWHFYFCLLAFLLFFSIILESGIFLIESGFSPFAFGGCSFLLVLLMAFIHIFYRNTMNTTGTEQSFFFGLLALAVLFQLIVLIDRIRKNKWYTSLFYHVTGYSFLFIPYLFLAFYDHNGRDSEKFIFSSWGLLIWIAVVAAYSIYFMWVCYKLGKKKTD
jgi:hypothetical protein